METVRQGKRRVDKPGAFADFEWDALYRRKQFEEALALLQEGTAANPVRHAVQKAVLLITLGRTAEAERLLLDDIDAEGNVWSDGLVCGYLYLLGPAGRTDPRRRRPTTF